MARNCLLKWLVVVRIRQRLGARSIIPAKRGKKTWRIHGVRAASATTSPAASTADAP